ncbi:MAG: MFS transporter [Chloroflexota bacterium]
MTTSPLEKERSFLGRMADLLGIPAYRLLLLNSVFGSMRLITVFVARGWLVLTITDSPFWVGAAPAVRGFTQILAGTFAGVLLDRVSRRTALILVEIGNSIVPFTLGVLIFLGEIQLWHVLAASFVEGLLIAVRWPAISTMTLSIVGRKRLLNASAANMFGFNLGNIGASVLAGFIIDQFGIDSAYFFAAACGLMAGLLAWVIRGDFTPRMPTVKESVLDSIREGLIYIRSKPSLVWLILLGFLMSLFGWSNLTMLPVMARDVLGQAASGLGILTGAGALGSLISTGIIAGSSQSQDKSRLVMISGLLTTAAILAFSYSTWFPLSVALVAFMQAALMAFEVTIGASVLTVTSDKMQGRVQGVYNQVFGFTWIGGALLGAIAEFLGAPIAIAFGGIGIGLVVLLARRPLIRMRKELI